jgi:hypothetical protein
MSEAFTSLAMSIHEKVIVVSPWLTTTFTATTMSTSTPHVQADIAISPVRNFGEISEAAIRQAVQDRFCLLVLLSYETCDSQWCRLEWTWHVGPAALYLLRVLVRLAFGDSLELHGRKSCMKRADVSAALEQSLLIVFDSPLSAIVDIA